MQGNKIRVLNAAATQEAQMKQQQIEDAFKDWIWKDPTRRQMLVKEYNERFNSLRPREYDGSHILFHGMSPEITLRPHQKNAIAHILYGTNLGAGSAKVPLVFRSWCGPAAILRWARCMTVPRPTATSPARR